MSNNINTNDSSTEFTIPQLTDVIVPADTVVIRDDYVQAQHSLESAVQAAVMLRTQLNTAIQAAIERADTVRALAESRALAASEQARALAEQAKTAAADSTRFSQEAREAADTVRYHQGLLAGAAATV